MLCVFRLEPLWPALGVDWPPSPPWVRFHWSSKRSHAMILSRSQQSSPPPPPPPCSLLPCRLSLPCFFFPPCLKTRRYPRYKKVFKLNVIFLYRVYAAFLNVIFFFSSGYRPRAGVHHSGASSSCIFRPSGSRHPPRGARGSGECLIKTPV